MEIKPLHILFTPNWNVASLNDDDQNIQAPNKVVTNQPYWFFKFFPKGTLVDVLPIGKENLMRKFEHKLKFYIIQPIKAFMRRNKYDVVISHGAQSGLIYEMLASFTHKKPLHVMFDIGGLNGARINKTETPIIKFALRKAPVIIVHASRQLDFYKDFYPNLSKKTYFVPFGTDFDYFNRVSGNDHVKHQFISVGYAKRDYQTLCDAFVRADTGDYTLCIVGDTSLSNKYKEFENIQFFPKVPISKLLEMTVESAAVFVPLPEYKYSYGQMTILQSMAMGKPLIVTRTTSTADYIDKAPGVIKTEPYDVSSMVEAINNVCSMPHEQLREIGASNSTFVKNMFNEQQMAVRVYDIICKHLCANQNE